LMVVHIYMFCPPNAHMFMFVHIYMFICVYMNMVTELSCNSLSSCERFQINC
jgi:hypothetical protein